MSLTATIPQWMNTSSTPGMFSTSTNTGYWNIIASGVAPLQSVSRLVSFASSSTADNSNGGTFVVAFLSSANQLSQESDFTEGGTVAFSYSTLHNIASTRNGATNIMNVDGTTNTVTGQATTDWVSGTFINLGAQTPLSNIGYWDGFVCALWASNTIPSSTDQATISNYFNFLFATV